MAKIKRQFDLAETTRVAARAATTAEFCREMNILPTSFASFRRSNPEFAEAFERGRRLRASAGGTDPRLEKLTTEDFRRFGARRLEIKTIAAEIGVSQTMLNTHLTANPSCKAAYQNGKKEMIAAAAVEPAAVSPNSSAGDLPERISAAVADGWQTCAEIAAAAAAAPVSVYNCLAKKVADGEFVKTFDSENVARYQIKNQATVLPPPVKKVETSATGNERSRILRAVGEGNNLSRSICMATGIPIGVVIEEVEAMAGEQIVIRRETSFVAYFLKKDAPADDDKLILNGNGGVTNITRSREDRKPPARTENPICGRCAEKMMAQHFEEKVVSWYCAACWEQWDKGLTADETEEI